MIYLYLKKKVNRPVQIKILFLFMLLLLSCGNKKNNNAFYREEQIFTVLDNQRFDVKETSGFIFILKSFGCSKCEEVTYRFINKLLEDKKIDLDKAMYVISNNEELLLRKKLYNDTQQRISYIILDNYVMAKYGLIYNTDMLFELKEGRIINFVPITDENYKELINSYVN